MANKLRSKKGKCGKIVSNKGRQRLHPETTVVNITIDTNTYNWYKQVSTAKGLRTPQNAFRFALTDFKTRNERTTF